MSRGYSVQWISHRAPRIEGDQARIEVDLLSILEEQRMLSLLKREFKRDGRLTTRWRSKLTAYPCSPQMSASSGTRSMPRSNGCTSRRSWKNPGQSARSRT